MKIIKFLRQQFFNTCPRSRRIVGLKNNRFMAILFPLFGFSALLWVLVRLVPKPSRAAYPCMKIAAPVASTFLVWLVGLASSFFVFRQVRTKMPHSKTLALLLIFIAATVFTLTGLPSNRAVYGDNINYVDDPYGANNPVGEPKGIFPGRVIWVWNPDATNENCRPDKWGDGYFLDKNCDQDVVDEMLANALLRLTGMDSEQDAWNAVFHYFNQHHGKGDVGYIEGETIFIKINAVHAWTTNNDGSIRNDGSYGNVDTSPQAVLAMLRQLVHKAGVPQDKIYIGDPYTHIFSHCLEKWRKDFPNIHYMDKSGIDGREKYIASREYKMHFSDEGRVLSETRDKYFTVMEEADYLLNIPAMKGHRWGGVTLFGKNFFGANTRSGAGHMHPGLHREDYDQPLRGQYGMYRVFVDLLGHKDLGGKSLLYFMDALWSCSYEHEPPVKFKMAPFNNDWTSSILLSLDPLAIESVCLDILQAEFPKQESEVPGNYWYANFPAIDDYLHQAADRTNWPEGITYDPEGDGTPIGSLGVHEHWNNPIDQEYTRNLGTGDGIELIKLPANTAVAERPIEPVNFVLLQNYPNPFNPVTQIEYKLDRAAMVRLLIIDINGHLVRTLVDEFQSSGLYNIEWNSIDRNTNALPSGVYFSRLIVDDGYDRRQYIRRMTLLK
ncbi:DUF362 domain-containing protein [candidate division KSB1 bacterium]|nr:DUF362 domain-containing protein [candidate division KSB1 bacterium]RQW05656.1 MAG: DUF362 domain-containing protein [candidate division KSB1 bacterium]